MQQVVTDPNDPRFGLPVLSSSNDIDMDPTSPTFGQPKASGASTGRATSAAPLRQNDRPDPVSFGEFGRRMGDVAKLVPSAIAAEATGGMSLLPRLLAQAGAGAVTGGAEAFLAPGATFSKMGTGAATEAGLGVAASLLPEGIREGARWLGPKLRQEGLNLGKSVWKVRDSAAKLASEAGKGKDVAAGADQIILGAAEKGRLAPTRENRQALFGEQQQAGKAVKRAWLVPPEYPADRIERPDRLLPSHGTTSVDTLTSGSPWTQTSGPRTAAAIPGTKYREAPFPVVRPVSRASGGFAGDQIPTTQYLGHGVSDEVPHFPEQLRGTARDIGPAGTGDTLSGPGVMRREVPQTFKTQPIDTIRRDDILGIIDARLADSQGHAAPTAGLRELRARWEIMPEYIGRERARGIVSGDMGLGINPRLAASYHSPTNDPVAVATEKDIANLIKERMMTKTLEAANEAYGTVKPIALASSHAHKRGSAREMFGLGALAKMGAAATAGTALGGPIGGIVGTGLGIAAAHPVTQGKAAQRMYDIGKSLMSGSANRAVTPDALRLAILALLQQQGQ